MVFKTKMQQATFNKKKLTFAMSYNYKVFLHINMIDIIIYHLLISFNIIQYLPRYTMLNTFGLWMSMSHYGACLCL